MLVCSVISGKENSDQFDLAPNVLAPLLALLILYFLFGMQVLL